jgi:uncharacterized protein (TIGR02270 family)
MNMVRPEGPHAAAERPVAAVVSQHAEECALLFDMRSRLVDAPHVGLQRLSRIDARLAAHLDGIRVAGTVGQAHCEAGLEQLDAGTLFAAAVSNIDRGGQLWRHLALVTSDTVRLRRGLLGALGWVSSRQLEGKIAVLLQAHHPGWRELGIAACRLHRVDDENVLRQGLADADAAVRAAALRAAGEGGHRHLLAQCRAALDQEDARCRQWALRSCLLLGEPVPAMPAVADCAGKSPAFSLLLKVLDPARVRTWLGPMAKRPDQVRVAITGAGIGGDPAYVPWLMAQMAVPALSRLAGEAFSTITGLDLALLDLDRNPPDAFDPGPNDDPEDDNVSMDDDEGLPWPDAEKIAGWWRGNGQRFAAGQRFFMGAAPTVPHCRSVLREGTQRQRAAAAEYLCLLEPGTRLFPTGAPAWRQERWLRQIG